jgi:DNA-binding SARP family transcriptional activator/tetratricopeptide (TPR) repeat protein
METETEAAFSLLGPLLVRVGDEILPIQAGKQRALLAALLLRPNQMVSRDDLAEVLWGGHPPPSGRVTLQNYVKRLRKTLAGSGETRIRTLQDGYLIFVRHAELDVLQFEALHQHARDAARAGAWQQAADDLRLALSLWRGEPLADVASELLLLREVPRLAELRLQATQERIGADLRLGRHADVIAELRGLTAAYPLRERLHAMLMLALYRDGQQSEALATFRRVRQLLVEELGAEPGRELRQLEQQILTGDPALTEPGIARLASEADSRQLSLPGPFARETEAPASLPADLSDFTGRRVQASLLAGLLIGGQRDRSRSAVALTAVTGTGGVGKTALAVHAAHQVSGSFPDGQIYLNVRGSSRQPLAPSDALTQLLRELGAEPGGVTATEADRAARFRTLTAAKRMLLLIDDARDAAQVRSLIPGGSGCAVLLTSRRSLADLEAARVVELDVMGGDEATALFASIVGPERAAAEPEALGKVLAACGGLPLAIRIAAARLSARPTWSVEALAHRLDDEHRRLDELRAGDLAVRTSFMMSYASLALLNPESKVGPDRAFRLAGLANGPDISLQAAAALLGVPPEVAEKPLEELVDAHLLQSAGSGRYRFHDLLRLYAAERARDDEGPDAKREAVSRLLSFYLVGVAAASKRLSPSQTFPATFPPPLPGTQAPDFATQDEALAWLDLEYANLVAAVDLAVAYGEHEVAWKLPVSMWEYFARRGNMNDWIGTHEIALASVRSLDDRDAELGVLNDLAGAYSQAGRMETAVERIAQLVAVARQGGSPRALAISLQNLGSALADVGRLEEAAAPLSESLSAHRESRNRVGEGITLVTIASVCRRRKDYDQAVEHLHRAASILREAGDRMRENEALLELSAVHLELGQLADTQLGAAGIVSASREIGDRSCEARALTMLGNAEFALGHRTSARTHWAEALAIFTELGDVNGVATTTAELDH